MQWCHAVMLGGGLVEKGGEAVGGGVEVQCGSGTSNARSAPRRTAACAASAIESIPNTISGA